MQSLVTLSYFRVVHPLRLVLRLATNVLPLWLFWSLPACKGARLRTPLVTILKLMMAIFMLSELSNDYFTGGIIPEGLPWPLFAFKLAHTARVRV